MTTKLSPLRDSLDQMVHGVLGVGQRLGLGKHLQTACIAHLLGENVDLPVLVLQSPKPEAKLFPHVGSLGGRKCAGDGWDVPDVGLRVAVIGARSQSV